MDRKYLDAAELLGSFRPDQPVRVTADGREMDMRITRVLHRVDEPFGSLESSRVTVSYGPGRYARDVSVEQIVHGLAKIEPRTVEMCFCGEEIDYDKPGSEGGEFITTKKFRRRYPQFKEGESVIGHAQCGLDNGLIPA